MGDLVVIDDGEVLVISGDTEALVLSGEGAPGLPGPSGPSGALSGGRFAANFSYGVASPSLLMTIATGKRAYRFALHIQTPFDGIGAGLSIGSALQQQELQSLTDNDPYTALIYETTPDKLYASATQIYLFINPGSGASSGAGQVIIYFEP